MEQKARSALSGLCTTCRYVQVVLRRYTVAPWDSAYECSLRAEPLAPHARGCRRHEREPGSD